MFYCIRQLSIRIIQSINEWRIYLNKIRRASNSTEEDIAYIWWYQDPTTGERVSYIEKLSRDILVFSNSILNKYIKLSSN